MNKPDIARWVRQDIRALSAYHVADADKMVKLDAMENPFSWDESMRAAWVECLETPAFNRYPDPSASALQQEIRSAMKVPAGCDLLLGNGSDELIHIMITALAKPGAVVLAPTPGFVMYQMIAQFNQVGYIGVPLQADFELDMPAMRTAIEKHQPALVFLAYPNNPTANLFRRQDIEEIIRMAPGIVVLDEAYAPFASDSFMQDLVKYANLVVMQTVSKMGLAGLRLGYMAAAPEWIGEFDKVRLPYNINVLTQKTVAFALKHKAVFDQQAVEICDQRSVLLAALTRRPEVTAYPSQANFILFHVENNAATQVFDAIRSQGVLIKNMSPQGGLLASCLRVTVGTAEENQKFLAALDYALEFKQGDRS